MKSEEEIRERIKWLDGHELYSLSSISELTTLRWVLNLNWDGSEMENDDS